jgi:hypothetical protein
VTTSSGVCLHQPFGSLVNSQNTSCALKHLHSRRDEAERIWDKTECKFVCGPPVLRCVARPSLPQSRAYAAVLRPRFDTLRRGYARDEVGDEQEIAGQQRGRWW